VSLLAKAIRHQVKSLLLGKTAAEDRVFTNRRAPLHPGEVGPSIVIYTLRDEAKRIGFSNRVWQRGLRLGIEVHYRQLGAAVAALPGDPPVVELDDALDDVCDQVERILLDDSGNLGLPPEIVSGTGTEIEDRTVAETQTDEAVYGVALMSFVVPFDTEISPSDEGLLPPWLTAYVNYHLLPPEGLDDDVPEAVDAIVLEQS